MKLSTKNIFALYYKWIYSELPKYICTFFWGTVLIIAMSPIVIPGRLVGYLHYEPDFWENIKSGFGTYAVYALSILFGLQMLGYEKGDIPSDITLFLWAPLLFLGAMVAVIGIIILGVIFIQWIIKQAEKKPSRMDGLYNDVPPVDPGPSKASILIGAIRKKHCTKIEWK